MRENWITAPFFSSRRSKKVWVAKVLVASVYLLFASAIHMTGVGILQSFLGSQLTPNLGWDTLLFASGVLFFVNLWQVPLCLFLAKKFGLSAAVSINILLGAALGLCSLIRPCGSFVPTRGVRV